MDPGDQSQLQLQPPLGYPYHEYAPSAIRPCATHVDDSGNTVAGLFHLLSCGHIVGVEDYDQRCGRNCQHAVTLVATPSLPGPNGSEAAHIIDDHLPPLSTTQAIDKLYCETCWGLPIDSYRRMHPTEPPKRIRHSFALTRSVLYSSLELHVDQIEAMLCPPSSGAYLPGFNWKDTHKLRCGHVVLSVPMRPCASNCAGDSDCQFGAQPENVRQGDAILCQECVFRSDLVFKRYAKVEEKMKNSRESGYIIADPQLTSSFGDHGNEF